jgi:hypothetical protein
MRDRRACSTIREDEKCVQNFGRKIFERIDHLEDLDGKEILI